MTMWKISAPVDTFTGEVAGCAFANGRFEGQASPGALQYFRGAGYTVEPVQDQEPAETKPPVQPPAKSASKTDWLEFAVTHRQADPVEADRMTRDELAATYATKEEK